MKESLSAEHSCELFGYSLEKFLDGCGISYECSRHLQSTWWNVAHSGLHVVGDPLYEIAAILVLYVQELFIYFL